MIMMSMYFPAIKELGKLETLFENEKGAYRWALVNKDSHVNYYKSLDREALIACLKSPCMVNIEQKQYTLDVKDMIYVPRSANATIYSASDEPSLIVIGEGLATNKYPVYVKKFEEAEGFTSGYEGYRRNIFNMVDERDPSDSLLAGYTEGWPGEWTSYPPHKHDDKMEVYVYYGLEGRYGIQIIETEESFVAHRVKDFDAVVILKGYHPNVPLPKTRICYLWILTQLYGKRSLGVEVHPDFKDVPMGKTHLKK
ncbi:MAG: hypothetical protein B6U94_08100 [Thermofilum sp. ex4484_79]|nr:MAG: hypothetical protein B6U94_08100 [Thermofilum sp. ex4484_79]